MKVLRLLSGRHAEVDVPVAYRVVVTTASSGSVGAATVTVPAGVFTSAPNVQLTVVGGASAQATLAEMATAPVYNADGTVTIKIQTYRTQQITTVLVNLGMSPVTSVSAVVHLCAYPA